jgi:translation initiation factor RLI1
MLLHDKIHDAYIHPQFVADVMRPLKVDQIIDQEVQNLSGGELQRLAMALCLGKPADVYLIDEPSAYLDSEQRLVAAKVRCDSVYLNVLGPGARFTNFHELFLTRILNAILNRLRIDY